MRNVFNVSVIVAALVVLSASAGADPVTLSNVPAYNWFHGCCPTAAGSMIGYYDLRGYANLFDASGWDAVKLTSNVQDHISSPAHNAKYDPTPDCATLPVPPDTSIACWMETSVHPRGYGSTYQSDIDDGFVGYVDYRGYACTSWYEFYGSGLTWQDLVDEVDAGRPILFAVDSNGDGDPDHCIPVFGYEDNGTDEQYYACYTTWTESETVAWYRFRATSNQYAWGVHSGTFVHMDPIPEPATVGLFALGGGMLALLRKRRQG